MKLELKLSDTIFTCWTMKLVKTPQTLNVSLCDFMLTLSITVHSRLHNRTTISISHTVCFFKCSDRNKREFGMSKES